VTSVLRQLYVLAPPGSNGGTHPQFMSTPAQEFVVGVD
jgi:hypothetical protein